MTTESSPTPKVPTPEVPNPGVPTPEVPTPGVVASEGRTICIGNQGEMPTGLDPSSVIEVDTAVAVIDQLKDPTISGVWIVRDQFPQIHQLRGISRSFKILRDMPEGVALIDADMRILWANGRLGRWITGHDNSVAALETAAADRPPAGVDDADWPFDPRGIAGVKIYTAFDDPEIMGPDFCPFHTALATGEEATSTLRRSDNRYFQVHAVPLKDDTAAPQLIVTVSDVTNEVVQSQKLEAIYQAGRSLADLRPSEVFEMAVDDRISLLKDNIRHYLSDLLNFEVVELRLLEQTTGNLVPLLAVGIDTTAARRTLRAEPRGFGITGWVAFHGESYICYDVENDPLFIPGISDAKSSLTVPLILHDEVLGTLNVESSEPRMFTNDDLRFLEIFSRDVAFALNTLELLVAQQADTARESCDAIHSAVAVPIDDILNDCVTVMEDYKQRDPKLVERLRNILQTARDIKGTIHKTGLAMTPMEAVPVDQRNSEFGFLAGSRILVVDADETVRHEAHRLLERYRCTVETAHHAEEAVAMVRAEPTQTYDVVISDIRLPDCSGYQLMKRLGTLMDPVPMVLMTAFGYDPGHSIVKARQAGMHPKSVLYKPFRMDQLIDVTRTVLELNVNNPPRRIDPGESTSGESTSGGATSDGATSGGSNCGDA